MFRRRSFNRFRRSSGFRGRPRLWGSTSRANRPRWNVSNFCFDADVGQNWADSQPFANVYTVLAIGGAASQSSPDFKTDSMQRGMIIGGIVMNYGWFRANPLDQESSESPDWSADELVMYAETNLVVDRYDADKIPQSVEFDYSASQVPTGSGSATTEHWDGPTRILHRRRDVVHQQFEEEATGASTGAWPVSQQVQHNRYTLNKKLRIRLDEEHGLYVVSHVRRLNPIPELNLERGVRFWYAGTLYWRVVF